MKSLQEYVLENINNDVNEGKVWDVIKDWFKNLFEPSNKEFDRYSDKDDNKISGANLTEFQEYLEDHFNENSITIKKIDFDSISKIIYPNDSEPNKDEKYGFYEFIDKLDNKTDYYGLIYEDSNAKDTACLINSKVNKDGDIEIIKLQVIQEFILYLPIKKVIKLLKKSNEFIGESKKIIVKEKDNKNLYNQVINDCKFEKKYKNYENIAILKLNETNK